MTDVDNYLINIPAPQREALERVRTIVATAAPDAIQQMSYGMPAFKYAGKPLLYYGAFKHHMSVFPTSAPAEKLRAELTGFEVSKGTIQFTLDHQLPEEIIIKLVKLRLESI